MFLSSLSNFEAMFPSRQRVGNKIIYDTSLVGSVALKAFGIPPGDCIFRQRQLVLQRHDMKNLIIFFSSQVILYL